MAQNLRLADPRTIKELTDTIHTSFVKHKIYQKIHYIHNWAIYPLRTHLEWAFEILDELITHFIHAGDKNAEEK